MPELPDVEIFRRYFERTSLNQQIKTVDVRAPEMVHGLSSRNLRKHLEHQAFVSTKRHGKYLFAELNHGKHLILHFGMTGNLKYFKDPSQSPPYIRLLIEFQNRYKLAFQCLRKLGKIGLTGSVSKFVHQRNLGPDVLAVDFPTFQTVLQKRKGRIKAALMDQHTMAGIGNLYADEILFQSRIHPNAKIEKISGSQKIKLFESMKSVLKIAIEKKLDAKKYPSDFLLRDRQPGSKCPLCGKLLKRIKAAGRTTYYCATHQKK